MKVHPSVYWFLVVFSLPTWLFVRGFRRHLSATHPWKNRRFTLVEWATHSTIIAHEFNLILWLWLLMVAIFMYRFVL